jgi:hypothetical protein
MANEWDIEAHDAFVVAEALAGGGAKVLAGAVKVTRHYGQMVATQVKANASGRPGPRAQTGDYRRSISFVLDLTDGVFAEAGTNKPQGRRLEFGFGGTDSLGRHFDQPPFPHFGPAIDRYGDEYAEAIAALTETI